MNKVFLPIAMAFAMVATSCQTLDTARDRINSMSQEEYGNLVDKTRAMAFKGGNALAKKFADNPELLGDIDALALQLAIAIEADQIRSLDIVGYVVERFAARLGWQEEQVEYVRAAAEVIDAAVGQIKLGVEGKLTDREKRVIVAFLEGIQSGISSAPSILR